MSTADKTSEQSPQDKSPEELRRDVEETRQQLGDTVEALAEKTDVKAQARRRIDSLKGAARQKQEQARAKAKAAAPESASAGAQQVAGVAKQNPVPIATGGAFVVGFLIGRWTK
jgi:F0F1-type ATP synthase membrane subunit b/b'